MYDYAHECEQLNNFGNEINSDGSVTIDEDGLPLRSKTEWQCQMVNYGIDEDGNPYIDYEAQNLDAVTTEFISDKEEYRITFRCNESNYCPRQNTKR